VSTVSCLSLDQRLKIKQMNWRSQVLTIGGIFQRFLAAKYELYERRTPLNVVKQDEQIDTFCNAAIHW